MTEQNYKKTIRSKILYAKDWGVRHNCPEIAEEMNRLLDYLDSPGFDIHDFLWFSSYKTALRIWNK